MRALLVTLLFALAACDRSHYAAPVKVEAAPALAPSFVSLVSASDQRTIHFRVAAGRSRALYLENCSGEIAWALEHQESGTVWGPAIQGCHSPPIEIQPGTAREFHKPLPASLSAGTYRLVVGALYFTHDSSDHSASIEVPHPLRLSQPFTRAVSVAP